jgi:hypothetical protein
VTLLLLLPAAARLVSDAALLDDKHNQPSAGGRGDKGRRLLHRRRQLHPHAQRALLDHLERRPQEVDLDVHGDLGAQEEMEE